MNKYKVEFLDKLRADFRRNYDCSVARFLLNDFFFPNYKFRFLVWLRICEYLPHTRLLKVFSPLASIIYHRYILKSGMEICFNSVGGGVKMQHLTGNVIVHSKVRIGRNSQFSPGVIIGISSLLRMDEVPVIGDDCYFSPNCKVYGRCHIGDRVVIGSDTVVRNMDIPSDSIVFGDPCVIKPMTLELAAVFGFEEATAAHLKQEQR